VTTGSKRATIVRTLSWREARQPVFFVHTIDRVLDGSKTMTRRRVLPGDVIEGEPNDIKRVTRKGRLLYEVGQLHAVQRGRGKLGEGRIRLTTIRREPVTAISSADVSAEGAASRAQFLELWERMYGAGEAERGECYVLSFELVRLPRP
jgi:hypothetical protein